MGFTIRNPEVEALVRELAKRRGVTPAVAIRDAVNHALESDRMKQQASLKSRADGGEPLSVMPKDDI